MKDQTASCGKCGENPIYIVKWGLCQPCYGRLKRAQYKAPRSAISLLNKKRFNLSRAIDRHENKGEVEFVKTFFTHPDWVHKPLRFRLNSTTYEPDFYDSRTGVFLEVSATRQAYHANKHKYKSFRKLFPTLTLEIRKPNGELIDESGRIDWSQ